MISFGNTLKRLRKQKKFTQETVAEILGVDRSTYSYYESGKTKPDFETILTVCKIYGVAIDEITRMFLNDSDMKLVFETEEKEYEKSDSDFNMLSDREQLMLMYYRQVEDKEGLFEAVKKFYDEDVLKSLMKTE